MAGVRPAGEGEHQVGVSIFERRGCQVVMTAVVIAALITLGITIDHSLGGVGALLGSKNIIYYSAMGVGFEVLIVGLIARYSIYNNNRVNESDAPPRGEVRNDADVKVWDGTIDELKIMSLNRQQYNRLSLRNDFTCLDCNLNNKITLKGDFILVKYEECEGIIFLGTKGNLQFVTVTRKNDAHNRLEGQIGEVLQNHGLNNQIAPITQT